MERVTRYKVLREESIEALEYVVNEYIEQGWQPLGAFYTFDNYMFYQAMIWY